jgi:GTP-binding protein
MLVLYTILVNGYYLCYNSLMSKSLPVVAIVGRANVGKSSLFNRIVGSQDAIVAREAGTTRDAVYRIVGFGQHNFWLVDTAGLKPAADEFEATIQEQIDEATEAADVIVVVVEAATTITEEDRRVGKKALKSRKTVILVTNKSDLDIKNSANTPWERLGIKTIIPTSTTQNRGVRDLLVAITADIPVKLSKEDEDILKIALLGRPNVGKSSLFNVLAKKQQAIVASLAGTTRDINRLSVKYKKQTIELMDTAGIRRSCKIEHGIEKFSVLISLQPIE